MGNRTLRVMLAGLLTFGTLLISARNEPQAARAAISGAANPPTNLGGRMPPSFDQEVARVVAEVDRIEADTLSQIEHTALDRQGQVRTLGKLLLFDKHLSVNQNQACSFCHTPETGFTGPIQSLNLTTVSYPGSVRTRFSDRKPQSYMYAPFAPVLHYNALQGDFVGGNFWDMRASGYRLQNPSAEQAQGPSTNPVEMGLADSACVAYRLSQAPYRKLFETVWGRTRSPFNGLPTWKRSVRLRGHHPRMKSTRSISAWRTELGPTTHMTASGWRFPHTSSHQR